MKAFLRGLGRGIDTVRTVLGRLFFLVFLAVIIYLLLSSPGTLRVPDQVALVLAPTGNIVEQQGPPGPAELLLGPAGMPNTPLPHLLRAIERAAADERIAALVLYLDELQGVSPSHLEALEEALLDFRESGKSIYAYGNYYGQAQYALAALADEVTLHPMGNLMLRGYGGNVLFFRELLERLHINAHVFRAGEFKAAAEPYTRMDLSEEARQDTEQLFEELWQRYIERVAEARDIEPGRLLEYANELPTLVVAAGGDMGVVALDSGLIDQLAGLDSFRQQMMERVGVRGETFAQIHYRDYLRATQRPQLPGPAQVAVLVAEGPIMPGEQARGTVGEYNMMALIRQARADEAVRAVVLRVNSPGGAMLASESIRNELSLLQAVGKPVVVSMGPVAASGGYWISATADQIWATPTTITGSIGVVGVVMTFEDSLAAIGVASDGVATAPLARQADPLSGMSESMRQIFQANIDDAYRRFINLVAEGRGLSPEEVESYAQGRSLTGRQAHAAGLVDELGDLPDAIQAAAELAGLTQWQTVYLQPPLSLAEQLLAQLMGSLDPTPVLNAVLGPQVSGLWRQLPWAQWQSLAEVVISSSSGQRLQPLLICETCLGWSSPMQR